MDDAQTQWSVGPDRLSEIEASISDTGAWQHYVELRMGAGANLRIEAAGPEIYRVEVTWGSQRAESRVSDLDTAVQVAYRFADTFLGLRSSYAGSFT